MVETIITINSDGRLQQSNDLQTPDGNFTVNAGAIGGLSAQVGDGTNYCEVETNGTIHLVGSATVFEDLQFPAISGKVPVSNFPDIETMLGGIQGYAFDDTSEQSLFFQIQMPHSWKEGSLIYPHIHWLHDGTDADGGDVVWGLEYSWANMEEAFTGPAIMTAVCTAGTALKHEFNKLLDGSSNDYIDGSGKTISSILICRVFRDATDDADTLAADAWLLALDIHVERDTMGSRSELIK